MLRGGWLCVCLLLYCNIFRAEDRIPVVFTEKPQPHPRYLKEFFPFVLKEGRGEAMKPLLAGLKRTSDSNYASDEEIHQGSLISYVEELAPRVARDENVEEKSQENFVAKTVKDPNQSNPSKTKNITKNEKTWGPTHKSKTTSKLVKSYHPSPAPHTTKRPTGTKKVKKRTENVNKRAMTHAKAHDFLEKRSGTLMKTEVRDNVNQLLDEKKMDMRSVVSQPIYFPIRDAVKPTIVPSNPNRLSFDMAMTTMKSRSLMGSESRGMYNDAPNRKRSIGMDLNEVDFEKMEKIVSKREVRHKPKKSVKSIITKILIIPVERQIEEGGEEVPEEIDVVSLKHSRDGKKRKKQRKGSSTALSPSATIMTASFVATDLNRRPTDSCGETTAREKSTTCPPLIITEPTKQCTTTPPATTCTPSFIKSSSYRPSTYPTTKPTTRKKVTTGLAKSTTDSTTEMSSTMISLTVAVALSKGPDSNITTCATDEKTESELTSECLTTTTECPV